jgi:hypothetical protein
MNDSSPSSHRFTQLVVALSRRAAAPLEAQDGLLVLVDAGEAVQLVVELSDTGDNVVLIARVMSIPQHDPAGTLALRLLRFNADRGALDGAVIAADGLRRQIVLIRELSLDDEPETLAGHIEALLNLAAIVRADAAGDRSSGAGTAALLLRAGRGPR